MAVSPKSRTKKAPSTPETGAKPALPWAKHVVCFWKQNDLGLFGRRPDRWIEYWRQHPEVEKVLVFEPPLSYAQLQEMLRLATTLDKISASEYQLLLQQATRKLIGQCDDNKVKYCTYMPPKEQAVSGPQYLSWVLERAKEESIEAPLVVLWPACFANEALIKKLQPSHILVDLVDDQRLFPGNETQRQAITEQYQTFMKLGQQVVSNSAGLIESFSQEFDQPVEHLPNALLPMLPLGQTSTDRQLATHDGQRPVIGYVGNMRGRIDIETLTQVMHKHPEWDFWFVGQTHRSEFYKAVIHMPNARFWGTLNYIRSNAVMSKFDVAIIPFMENALVNSMSPIKKDDYNYSKIIIVELNPKNKNEFEKTIQKKLLKEYFKIEDI